MKRNNTIVILLSVVIVAAGGFIAYSLFTNESKKDTQTDSRTMTREQALEDAEDFSPPDGTMCTQVLTPAVHKETGAAYTFPTGCIPDGWERDDPAEADTPAPEQNARNDEVSRSEPAPNPDARQAPSNSNTSRSTSDTSAQSSAATTSPPATEASEKDAALAAARNYQPPKGQMCTQVLTPARHKKTGAVYTFPTGCIPDGWERIKPGAMVPYAVE